MSLVVSLEKVNMFIMQLFYTSYKHMMIMLMNKFSTISNTVLNFQ